MTEDNDEPLKYFKLEEPGNKLDLVKKLIKLEKNFQVDSKWESNGNFEDCMKIKLEDVHNNSVKDKVFSELKTNNKGIIYSPTDNAKTDNDEKSITDINKELQVNLSQNNQGCLDDLSHCQVQSFSSSEGRTKKKNKKSNCEILDINKVFMCDKCSYQSQSRRNFIDHLRVHSPRKNEPRRFKCYHCHYSTIRRSTLTKHMATHTESRDIYKCSQCGAQYKQRYNLIRHTKTGCIHSPGRARQFKCTVCALAYGTSYELIRHKFSHSEDLPYKCAHCCYATTRRTLIMGHLRRHGEITVGNGKTTTRKQQEKIDVGLKPNCQEDKYPFECDICGYRTSKRSLVKYHILRKHTKEPVFNCLSCNYSTFCQNNLKKHRRSQKHDILTCGHCDYIGLHFKHIQQHMKIHFK